MQSTAMESSVIEDLLRKHCYETARRRCAEHQAQDPAIALLHVVALQKLGDPVAALACLDGIEPATQEQALDKSLLRVDLLHLQRGREAFIRGPEHRAGWDYEEYQLHYRDLALKALAEVDEQALDEQRRQYRDVIASRLGCDPLVAKKVAKKGEAGKEQQLVLPPEHGPHTLQVQLIDAEGAVVADAPLQIGIWLDDHFEPQIELGAMHIRVPTPACRLWRAHSDKNGCVDISDLPAGRLWMAVELDDALAPEGLRFVLHDIHFPEQAPERLLVDIDAARLGSAAGANAKAVAGVWNVYNPSDYDYAFQAVHVQVPLGFTDAHELYWEDAPEQPLTHQLINDQLLVMAAAPAQSRRRLLMRPATAATTTTPMSIEEKDGFLIVDTGVAGFRIPAVSAAVDAPPIDAVRQAGGAWRGQGRLLLSAGQEMCERIVTIREHGPLATVITIRYRSVSGRDYAWELTAHQDQAYVLVTETSQADAGVRFDFTMQDFIGGRGFLAKGAEGNVPLWSDLNAEDRELARMQESVAWMAGNVGFGYGMCDARLEHADYVGVFTRLRGDWDDQDFALIAQGPGKGRHEWDWPFPEMVGSTISMITAATTAAGDCGFNFRSFNGTRHWGIMVGDFANNDGPERQLWQIQQQCSSARLEDLITWQLDLNISVEHPRLLCQRDELPALRRKMQQSAYQEQWQGVRREAQQKRRCSAELVAVLERDAYPLWQRKMQLLRHLPTRVHMSILGRQWGDMYSPVGGRDITDHAEQFDLLAGCKAFTPEQERESRRHLLIIGQRFMDPDFMNWRYGGRNANFEADRVDIVGSIGLCLRGHPLADAMLEHVIERMDCALDAYCTPGSGKWYENPACYYVHAMTCRLHIAALLQRHGLWKVEQAPLLNDLLRWAALLVTPAYPQNHDLMRDGCSLEEWRQQPMGRWIPPVGDHAGLGREIPECHVSMAAAFDASDPALAATLRWLYQDGAKSQHAHSQNHLLFTGDDPSLLIPQEAPTLVSRRLEGFGAVMRHRFGDREDEGYVLFKQGPGGYRYHRSEGSLIYFEHGVPLLFDGGEAGETWRHTTLSRGDTHMPLAAGHVERWHSASSVDFAQGVHPLFIEPGEAVYLSDNCHHDLVQEAERRFNEAQPVDHRSCCYVKGDYVIVHDALNLPAANTEPIYFHMQTVADACTLESRGDWRLKGRFGIDVQILVPDQDYEDWSDQRMAHLYYKREAEDSFAMQHLQLQFDQPKGCLGVVRALAPGAAPLQAQVLNGHIREPLLRVRNYGINNDICDLHLFALTAQSGQCAELNYTGRYFSVLVRADRLDLQLHDAEVLACGSFALRSLNGEAAEISINRHSGSFTASATHACLDGMDLVFAGELRGQLSMDCLAQVESLCQSLLHAGTI